MNTRKGKSLIPVSVLVIVIVLGGFFFWKDISQRSEINLSQGENTQTGPCLLKIEATTTVYTRPNLASQKFGEISTLEGNIQLLGKTEDGWLGFDPGVAQAPNVGPFRLRYIPPKSPVTILGDCSALPVVPSLPPKSCFVMAQSDVPVYKSADVTSPVVATLRFGDYIEALSKKGKEPKSFIKVSSPSGTVASGTLGWVASDAVSVNGVCELPQG